MRFNDKWVKSNIINNAKNTLDINIVDKISEFKYKELDGYYVIEVYVKNNIKAKEMEIFLLTLNIMLKSVVSMFW